MCAANQGKPRVMVKYKENDQRTAVTVAHVLGHLLGMYHDFQKTSERLRSCGKGKFKGETVMNYGNNRTEWSECSRDDFKLHYNRVLKNDDKFCLQEMSKAAGHMSEDFASYEFEEVEPPEQIRLGVNIYLDTALGKRNLNRENALNILKHTQILWKHRSLSTKLDIRYDPARIFLSRKHLLITSSNYNTKVLTELVGPSIVDGYPTAHIYLTAKEPGETRFSAGGIGKVESMCAANQGKPRVMVEYKENDKRTAVTVAHVLGHLLGMYHDFQKTSERLQSCGKGKRGGETVMNYGNNRTEWSECSNYDFKLYYNRVLKKDDKFCLQEVSKAAGKK